MYDYMRSRNKYQIIVNKSESDSVFYANTIFDFLIKDDRDREYESMKNKLENFGIKFC